jgi:CcmD family protein
MAWVVAAFSAVWIAVFLYLVRLGRLQRTVADEIAALKRR